jgi:GLPGLI family protein
MRKIVLTLALAILSSVGTYAQLNEGSVSYKMEFESDEPDMEMVMAMMAGSHMDLYFKGDDTRADVEMGSMMSLTTVTNSKSEDFLMLMDISMMGMKYGVKSTLAELEKNNDTEESKLNVSLEKDTKKILGYKCKKAVATDEEGNETIFWYTEEIQVNKRGQSYLNEDVPGFPLEYEIMQGGMKIMMQATSFEEKVDKKKAKELFSMAIPEGYEEKTLDDLMGMGGGGM